MSHTKTGGATRQHTTRPGKRRGVKLFGGQAIKVGMIIVRQQGTIYHPGEGVGMGRDHTLFALRDGSVSFYTRKTRQFITVV